MATHSILGIINNLKILPLLAWRSGLSAGLQAEGSQVPFPSGCIPGWGCVEETNGCTLHISVSLPFFLPLSKSK